ncbi:MAG: hypothetical protein ACM3W4_04510 [Ignavibacteriales bacterium]
MTAWGLDIKITVACAIVSAIMAVLQLVAAALSLRAAWRIAGDQRGEAQRLRNAGQANFIEAVSALAKEAIHEADKAEVALRAGSGPNGTLYNFSQRLADLHEALQPIRSTAPADAKLMLAVGRFSRVLVVDGAVGIDQQMAIQLVGQHRGSIGLALTDIQDRGQSYRAPDQLKDSPDTAEPPPSGSSFADPDLPPASAG